MEYEPPICLDMAPGCKIENEIKFEIDGEDIVSVTPYDEMDEVDGVWVETTGIELFYRADCEFGFLLCDLGTIGLNGVDDTGDWFEEFGGDMTDWAPDWRPQA